MFDLLCASTKEKRSAPEKANSHVVKVLIENESSLSYMHTCMVQELFGKEDLRDCY